MKKQSVFFKSALAFIAFYALYTIAFTTYAVFDTYNSWSRTFISNETMYLKLGKELLERDKIDDVTDALNFAVSEDQIYFYLLRVNGVNFVYGNKYGELDKVPFPEGFQSGIVETERYRFAILHQGPYELIVGHEATPWQTFLFKQKIGHAFLIKDFLIVVISMFALMLYSFRDLRLLVRKFSEKGARRGDETIAKSKETLTLVRGLSGYEDHVDRLSQENAVFRGQVLPALKKELQSGKKPPYEFDCTLVRTDINNFTSVFSSDKRAHFMATINEFFVGVTHIVSRYNGSVYEFIGDEVLFYFKDSEHDNSAAIAVSALRDINRLALEISERSETEAEYQFRVKSSVAWGTLRFGPLVDGFALAGPTLIETVRMLSHIHEKSENAILVDQSLAERVADLARTQPHQVVMLKGLSGSRHLHRLEAFTPVTLHLRQSTPESLERAQYYRHDDDIVEILNFIELAVGQSTDGVLNKVLGHFKTYKALDTTPALRRSYLNLLNTLISRAENAGSDDAQYLLASTISMASNFFTPREWNGELREAFLKCLHLSNRRVVANALDVFAEIEPQAAEKIFETLAGQKDNRIAANALIKEGKREWDRSCAKKLEEMLSAKSPFFKASGLYALGEIAVHLKETDAAAYSADARLQKLLEQVLGFAFHANAMVRRQALKAVAKGERYEALSSLLAKRGEKVSSEVANEITQFLGDRVGQQATIRHLPSRRTA
ncbi:MAG: adenylate/guanylate cyclase domain-containing protein [Bdellovibrionota bacterium]